MTWQKKAKAKPVDKSYLLAAMEQRDAAGLAAPQERLAKDIQLRDYRTALTRIAHYPVGLRSDDAQEMQRLARVALDQLHK
jgi:hypothetical protein